MPVSFLWNFNRFLSLSLLMVACNLVKNFICYNFDVIAYLGFRYHLSSEISSINFLSFPTIVP